MQTNAGWQLLLHSEPMTGTQCSRFFFPEVLRDGLNPFSLQIPAPGLKASPSLPQASNNIKKSPFTLISQHLAAQGMHGGSDWVLHCVFLTLGVTLTSLTWVALLPSRLRVAELVASCSAHRWFCFPVPQMYIVQVQRESPHEFTYVQRTFEEFQELHNKLRLLFPSSQLPR